jgi:hypothetical protein
MPFPKLVAFFVALLLPLHVNAADDRHVNVLMDLDGDRDAGCPAGVRFSLTIDPYSRITVLRDRCTYGRFEAAGSAGATWIDDRTIEIADRAEGDRRLRVVVPAAAAAASTPQIWYVRNNAAAGGDGSRTAPLNLLTSAESKSKPGDIIFLFAGNETTLNQNLGITLKDGQSLIGEGVALVVDNVTLVPAGKRPLITSVVGAGIRVANNNTVRGVTVTDAKGGGIVALAPMSSLTLDTVIVRRSGTEALRLDETSGVVSINASEFDTAPGDLVQIATTSNLSLQVTNSHFTHTAPPLGNDGLRVIGGGSGMVRVIARGNTFDNLIDDAIDITGRGVATDAYTLDAEIADNQFATPFDDGQRRGANAIAVKAQSHELITATITGNKLTSVGGPGAIELTADDSSTLRGRVAANEITGSAANGIDVQADETTDVALAVENNTIRQSSRYGIAAFGFPGDEHLDITVANNHIALSQRDGVMLALYGGTMLATVAGNDVTAPVGMGYLLTDTSPGNFMLRGDPSRSAQQNVQQSNTGSVGTAGVISVISGRQRVIRK